jgi:hypothetical protein
MTTHTFGTTINPAHYVEIPDPTDAGQVIRPDAGVSLRVRNADTLADLTAITTTTYGYWSYTVADVPAILVSGDNGTTWVGPLYSDVAAETSLTAGALAQQAITATSVIPALTSEVQSVQSQVSAHTAAADPHPAYMNTVRGDARYVRTVGGIGPDASGNVPGGGAGGTISSLDQLPLSVPGIRVWSGTAWPTRASVTAQSGRVVFSIGNPGGIPPSDHIAGFDVWIGG